MERAKQMSFLFIFGKGWALNRKKKKNGKIILDWRFVPYVTCIGSCPQRKKQAHYGEEYQSHFKPSEFIWIPELLIPLPNSARVLGDSTSILWSSFFLPFTLHPLMVSVLTLANPSLSYSCWLLSSHFPNHAVLHLQLKAGERAHLSPGCLCSEAWSRAQHPCPRLFLKPSRQRTTTSTSPCIFP